MDYDNSKWRDKYDSIREYYESEYDPQYYSFDELESSIDPDETLEDLDYLTPSEQIEEIKKCHSSFSYFCHRYVKIAHPTKGLLPFILYDYQKRTVACYDVKRFNIIRKFRQGGLTTVTVLWALWRAMYRNDEVIMLASKTDREAIVAGEIADRAMKNFPTWMVPKLAEGGDNKHEKHFDTGSKLLFYTAEAARGRSITYLILDEAAFIKDMERHWAALFPTLSAGGKCIAISTVNGVGGIGGWYYDQYHGAEQQKNYWNIIQLSYKEHPEYNDEKWLMQMEAQLGPKKFRQEILGDFLGSGTNFIPNEHISRFSDRASKQVPIRKRFPEYQNSTGELSRDFDLHADVGALWIFKEPVGTREYIIGVDVGEGLGEENDNSCLQVIDKNSLEQVAEFYSQECPVAEFAKIVENIGHYYNTALIVVEAMGPGPAVIMKLQESFYENLYYDTKSNSLAAEKPGMKINNTNRSTILESLKNRLIHDTITINSVRFCAELKTFVWNRLKNRPEAQTGYHDDAILAMALATYVRDRMQNDVPVGMDPIRDPFENDMTEIHDAIRGEVFRGAPEDWSNPWERTPQRIDNGEEFDEFWSVRRKHHAVLREFGW